MIIDPATLPPLAPCVGCGATMRARLDGGPGARIMYHPAPLCPHILVKMAELGLTAPEPGRGYAFTDGKLS